MLVTAIFCAIIATVYLVLGPKEGCLAKNLLQVGALVEVAAFPPPLGHHALP
jgi:hypothetical protein